MELAAAVEEEQKQLHTDLVNELRPPLLDAVSKLNASGMEEMKEAHEACELRLDKVIQNHEEVIDKTVWRVDNMFTRYVMWRVPAFKKKTFALMRHPDCYLISPSFSVCCLDEMALELQVAEQDN